MPVSEQLPCLPQPPEGIHVESKLAESRAFDWLRFNYTQLQLVLGN